MKLADAGLSGSACGKAILIGEHAAVDGYPAIAVPLHSQRLKVTFCEQLPTRAGISESGGWSDAWNLVMGDKQIELPHEERARLTQSLQLGLRLLNAQNSEMVNLNSYHPQRIEIKSDIPLGAGMGGSAALSAALLSALSQALQLTQTSAQLAYLANELDGFFHGRASGLDAATVVASGIIAFQRDRGAENLVNKKGFWLLLVDTGERTPTRTMVERVGLLREKNPHLVQAHFSRIGELTLSVRQNLHAGDLFSMGRNLNHAHESLQTLEVSTKRLDDCVEAMCAAGALGAKLTGGGGGGLALACFDSEPPVPFAQTWKEAPHYLTFVPSSENT